jgi:serine/threonine protein kinase
MSEFFPTPPERSVTPASESLPFEPLKGRYRVLKSLSSDGRTVFAIDEDTPSQTFCIVRSRNPQAGELPLTRDALLRWEQLTSHPHLPNLLAAFEENGRQYLVSEHILGQSAEDILQLSGTWNEDQVRQLLNDILPVLGELHDRQLLHRDIKPQNLLRRQSDLRWVLVDLSALHCTAIPVGARSPELSGSAEYAAPEQIEGRPVASSDLYSLGVTCIHLLTGQSPFDLYDDVSDVWKWRDRCGTPVSDRLARVLNRLLERELPKRYASAQDALNDLNRFEVPIPWTALLLLRPLAGLFAFSFAISLMQWMGEPKTAKVQKLPPVSPEVLKPLPQKAPSDTLSPSWSYDTGSLWSVAATPDGEAIVLGTADGMVKVYASNTDGQSPAASLLQFQAHPEMVTSVAVSPDGRFIATTGDDLMVKLWDTQRGNLWAAWTGHSADVYEVAFSPNGEAIASASADGTVRIWNATDSVRDRNSTPSAILSGHTDEVKSLAFSPNGRILATASADGTVVLWDWRTGQYLKTLLESDTEIWSVAISPDGQTLATGSKDGTVRLWDMGNGRRLRVSSVHRNIVTSLEFRPTPVVSSLGAEYLLVSGDASGKISFWLTGSGSFPSQLDAHSGWVDLAFSPDGRQLMTGGYNDNLKIWQFDHGSW